MSQAAISELHDDILATQDTEPRTPETAAVVALVEELVDFEGRVDVRHLWTRDTVSYFRVNWWRKRPGLFDHYVARSMQLRVEQTPTGLVARDVSAPVKAEAR